MRKVYILHVLLSFFLLSGVCSATIITGPLAVDFRNMSWAGANGQASYSVGPVTAVAGPGEDTLYQDGVDGLGILGGEPDEINAGEILAIVFNTPLPLSGVWITDLFAGPDGGNGETGQVTVFNTGAGPSIFPFWGNNADQGNGEIFVDFGGNILLDGAIFEITGEQTNNEFSVAGFTVAPVPEPATILMIGCGLIGLAGIGRKKVRL
ncbi:MAG: PEP-CTERM sorting domain-containing protein [Thermodesulfobacteriota bacterium]